MGLDEVACLTKYLLNGKLDIIPTDKSRLLYDRAVATIALPMSNLDFCIWQIMIQRPALIPFVDSGLCILDKFNPIRHRIYLMSCILETEPKFSKKFLSYNFHVF